MAVPTLTPNSPTTGSIAWSGFTIQYGGVGYSVAAASTSSRFVWWRYNAGSPLLQSGVEVPQDLTIDDLILFGNKNGTPINLQTAGLVEGGLIVDGSILADALSANSVTAEKILAGSIDATKIVAGSIDTNSLAAGAVTADKITANSITADKLATVLIIAQKLLLGSRITMSDTGIEIRTDAGVISFPSNGSAASIAADLVAFSLTVMDSLNVRGANNYIAGTLSAASGILDPSTPPTLSNYWVSDDKNYAGSANFNRSQWITQGQAVNQTYGLAVTGDSSKPSGFVWQVYGMLPGGNETLVATLNETDWGTGYNPSLGTLAASFFLHYDGLYYLTVSKETSSGSGVYTYKAIKYNASFVKQSEWAFTFPGGSGYGAGPFLGSSLDQSFTGPSYGLVIVWRRSSDSKMIFQLVSNTGTLVGAAKVSNTTTTGFMSYADGTAYNPFGGYTVAVGDQLTQYTPSGTASPADNFGIPPKTSNYPNLTVGRSNSTFESYVELDAGHKLWHYTSAGAINTFNGKYTWYDSDAAGTYGSGTESKASPARQFDRTPGALLRIDIPAPPDGGDPDDPNTARIYISDILPATASTYKLQGTLTPGQTASAIVYAQAGSPSPTTSGFAGRPGAVGILRSVAADVTSPIWNLRGDGAGRVGPLSWDTTGAMLNPPMPVGSIQMYAGTAAPSGYLLCDGSSQLRIGPYAALFAIISTTYGFADSTHFNLPDLRGRVAVGVGTAVLPGTSTLAPGATAHTLGQASGEETHLLTAPESGLRDHAHSIYVRLFTNTATATGAVAHTRTDGAAGGSAQAGGEASPTMTAAGTNNSGAYDATTRHNVMQPYVGMNYIIKT